jgi:hypothetical protein
MERFRTISRPEPWGKPITAVDGFPNGLAKRRSKYV